MRKIFERNADVIEQDAEEQEVEKKLLFVQYRGRLSDHYERELRKLNAPCKVVFTMRKLKTCLPSLKSHFEKCFKSGVVYQIKCSRCDSCYVGQTTRHLITRLKEHQRSGPVRNHLNECRASLEIDNVNILCSSSFEQRLMTLEALMIREIKPKLNTKDEYKSRALVITC